MACAAAAMAAQVNDPSLLTPDPQDGPLVISSEPDLLPASGPVHATDFKALVLDHIFSEAGAETAIPA